MKTTTSKSLAIAAKSCAISCNLLLASPAFIPLVRLVIGSRKMALTPRPAASTQSALNVS